ncbi:MAG: hypothetical protein AAB316_13430, partial [Bacteroidota bacterium]
FLLPGEPPFRKFQTFGKVSFNKKKASPFLGTFFLLPTHHFNAFNFNFFSLLLSPNAAGETAFLQ